MKTRLGFVSNSSSSSFVLLGFAVSTEKIDGHEKELVIKLGLTTEEKLSK